MNNDVGLAAIVKSVEKKIIGRVANVSHKGVTNNIEVVLYFVAKAISGNYLEIGTLFGGSAIPVAILKKLLKQSGLVFCIDPLNGYYRGRFGPDNTIDPHSAGFAVTPETLFENIRLFGVGDKVFVMQASSTDCPSLDTLEFSVVYIDGDHWNGVPIKDWLYIKDHATKFVIFDNCDDHHLDVQAACKIASDDPEWECVYDEGISYVVERIK